MKKQAELTAMLTLILQELKTVYSNKSSDEYKMGGDITKAPEYKRIEERITELGMLQGFPKENVSEIKKLFSTLHRPIFKQMVAEYIKSSEPNDANVFYTAIYTVGYRVLIGELARIFASTIIDDKKKVIVYKPDKISREGSMDKFIKMFNVELDKAIDEFVKLRKQSEVKQEGAVEDALNFTATMVKDILGKSGKILVKFVAGIATGKFNPISFIGTALSAGYTAKVKSFDNVCAHYEEAKRALEDYKKIPAHKQNADTIKNYQKLIDKYNIKMQNLSAKIKHYDQRAIADAETKMSTKTKTTENEQQKKPTQEPSKPDGDSGDDVIF